MTGQAAPRAASHFPLHAPFHASMAVNIEEDRKKILMLRMNCWVELEPEEFALAASVSRARQRACSPALR